MSLTMPAEDLSITDKGTHVSFEVHVNPRSKKNSLEKISGGVLYIKLTAPPVEDKANQQLVRMIAESLQVKVRDVFLISGDRSRKKVIGIKGISALQVKMILNRLLQGTV